MVIKDSIINHVLMSQVIMAIMEIIAKSDSHYVNGSYKLFSGHINFFCALGPVLGVIEA